jgi:hypothetical protein
MAKAVGSKPKGKEKKEKPIEISVMKIDVGVVHVTVLSDAGLLLNRMSEKAKHELLIPHGRLNQVERSLTTKHDPRAEFRASPYHYPGKEAFLALPAPALKGMARNVATDLPGTSKAQIGRLIWIPQDYVAVYGVPRLYMAVVRLKGMDAPPDIRTRAILPRWCATFEIHFAQPMLTHQAVANLIAAGGIIIGVGDGRQEKGTLSFGRNHIVLPSHPEVKRLMKTGGRKAQMKAMQDAIPYDEESAEMLAYWDAEMARRAKAGKPSTYVDAPRVNGQEALEEASD